MLRRILSAARIIAHLQAGRGERYIFGCVAYFTQEVMQGQLALAVGRLGGEGVELCGRSEAFVFGLDHQLFLLDHMHELDANECVLRCIE